MKCVDAKTINKHNIVFFIPVDLGDITLAVSPHALYYLESTLNQ